MSKPMPSAPSMADAVPVAYPVEAGKAVPQGDIQLNAWAVGLCGCFRDVVPNCCMVTFCPCVSLAQISARLGVLSYAATLAIFLLIILIECAMSSLAAYVYYDKYGFDDDDYFGEAHDHRDLGVAYHVYSSVSCAAGVLIFVYIWHLRTKTREQYQLPGSCCGDFCVTFWCSCCAVAQIATHVKSYKPGSCSFGPPDTLPAYPNDTIAAAVAGPISHV